MPTAIQDILKGNLPAVPLNITVDEKSIVKMCVAALITATSIILIAHIVKTKAN